MGVIDPKGAYSLADPEQHGVTQLVPQSLAIGVVEVDVDDVLVFLGRVLGIFDRAVGPEAKPFGMLAHPGMVRSALDREVERHLDPEFGSGVDEAAEIGE